MTNERLVKFANATIVTLGIFFTVGLIYARIKSQFYPPGSMKVYYVIFTAGLVVCLSLFRVRQKHRVNIAIAIASAVLGLYFIELGLLMRQVNFPGNDLGQTTAAVGHTHYDTRARLEVIEELQKQGVEAYPAVYPSAFLPDGFEFDGARIFPLGAIAAKRTVFCNESGRYLIYDSDEYGFNNPMGLHKKGEVDVVLVGDSFAQGFCVLEGQDIASVLRKAGKKTVSVGYGGDGPLIELATLTEYARPLQPKAVFWLYYEGNDLQDLVREAKSSILREYLKNPTFSQNLYKQQSKINDFLIGYVKRHRAELESFKFNAPQRDNQLSRVVRLYYFRESLAELFRTPQRLLGDLFRQILKQARDRTASWDGRLYFVYLPSYERYKNKVSLDKFTHREEILRLVNELNIPIIDLHEQVFKHHPDPLSLFPSRSGGHYAREGYELVAKTIGRYLNSVERGAETR